VDKKCNKSPVINVLGTYKMRRKLYILGLLQKRVVAKNPTLAVWHSGRKKSRYFARHTRIVVLL